MGYMDLINSFWDSATINPLSTGQVSLYFALLHVCNRSYWTEWFSVPNQVLSVLTGLSKSGILKARNELKQRGLIDFREKGNKATIYKIVAESAQESNQQSSQESVQWSNSNRQGVRNGEQNSNRQGVRANINILNNNILKDKRQKTEDKDKNARVIKRIERFEYFWCCYPLDKDRYLAEQAYIAVLTDMDYAEDDLVESAKNYAEYCKITGTDKIYHANNFLSKAHFEDYLPGRYRKPTPKKTQNGFNDFEQQDYDIEQLERDLLSN